MLPSLAPHWASLGLPVAHWAGAGPFPERAECGWLGGPRTCPASAVSAMETGRVLGAGAVLVALVVLGAHAAGGEEPSGVFLRMDEGECQYLNGTERVRFVLRQIYNREQFVHFDSDVGLFVADTALVPPEVEIYPVQSSSLPQIDRLVCAVMDFYPAEIEVKWFQNGREETERVVSTDVIPNGDWTYQVLVMLETTPQRGDTYTCQVEHVSLQHPVSQRWELQWDGARSKMLTGVGGFVLGLIFLVLGLGLYVRKKGAPIPGLQGS
ncbi:class II histocompatibility antigen, B-L beta chain-like isoform X2 [Strix uralensis]|uniref:class II histocompatibility antigen, B-L beta chain-like isoform X2 n=1 Tax=Strix uralensis TaxID=36305 RepID=UPI003DA738F5